KAIGGLDYNYAVKGGGQQPVKPVNQTAQERALKALLKTLDAQVIAIPQEKLGLFPPRALGFPASRESFKGRHGVGFDALSAAETSADMSLALLLHPQRASRLIQQKSLDSDQLGLDQVLDRTLKESFDLSHRDPYLAEIQNSINFRVLYHIMNLASAQGVHPQVNALAHESLKDLKSQLLGGGKNTMAVEMVRRIDAFLEEPGEFEPLSAPDIPDGSPIGMDCMHKSF